MTITEVIHTIIKCDKLFLKEICDKELSLEDFKIKLNSKINIEELFGIKDSSSDAMEIIDNCQRRSKKLSEEYSVSQGGKLEPSNDTDNYLDDIYNVLYSISKIPTCNATNALNYNDVVYTLLIKFMRDKNEFINEYKTIFNFYELASIISELSDIRLKYRIEASNNYTLWYKCSDCKLLFKPKINNIGLSLYNLKKSTGCCPNCGVSYINFKIVSAKYFELYEKKKNLFGKKYEKYKYKIIVESKNKQKQ